MDVSPWKRRTLPTLKTRPTYRPLRYWPPSRTRSRSRIAVTTRPKRFSDRCPTKTSRGPSSLSWALTRPGSSFCLPTTSTGIIAGSCIPICGCSGKSRRISTTIEPRTVRRPRASARADSEDRMRLISACTLLSLLVMASPAFAQGWQPPSDSQRCPSKWGNGDQRGSGNHMKPESVLKASRLIKTGEVFELGRVLQEGMPMPAGRRFEILTKRTRNDPGTNRRASNEELIVAEMGQVGTQFDTFSHQMIGGSMYNCFTLDDTASRTGFTKLGVEQVGALITRGVLIDVAAVKGM